MQRDALPVRFITLQRINTLQSHTHTHTLLLVLISMCGNAGSDQAGSLLSCEASCCWRENTTLLLLPGPPGLYRYALLCSLSNNTTSRYLRLPLMAQCRSPAFRKCQRVCVNPKTSQRKAAPGKTSRTVYAVTGITLYLFSSILKFVNDCHTEHSVTDARLHKHHVTGHANSELEI